MMFEFFVKKSGSVREAHFLKSLKVQFSLFHRKFREKFVFCYLRCFVIQIP